jgi:hypothetical protein
VIFRIFNERKGYTALQVGLTLAAILSLLPMLTMAQQGDTRGSYPDLSSIDSQEFEGFDRCEISKKLSRTFERLIAGERPLKKEEGAWTYAVKSHILDLPVKAVAIGVCDASGERACGWGSYVAVVIAKPFIEAREHLKRRTGMDFTEEKRDEETEVTLRPILAAAKTANESILFCDPGNL